MNSSLNTSCNSFKLHYAECKINIQQYLEYHLIDFGYLSLLLSLLGYQISNTKEKCIVLNSEVTSLVTQLLNSRVWSVNWYLMTDFLHYIVHFCLIVKMIKLLKIIYFNWRIIPLQYCNGFLPYINMNQPQVYICPPILNPTSLLTLSLWVVPEHWLWVPCFMHQTCTGHLFYIWQYTCFSFILSNHHPTLIFSHRVQKSLLYIFVSFAALHVGSSLPSF